MERACDRRAQARLTTVRGSADFPRVTVMSARLSAGETLNLDPAYRENDRELEQLDCGGWC